MLLDGPGCSNDESLLSWKILGNLIELSTGFWTDTHVFIQWIELSTFRTTGPCTLVGTGILCICDVDT